MIIIIMMMIIIIIITIIVIIIITKKHTHQMLQKIKEKSKGNSQRTSKE